MKQVQLLSGKVSDLVKKKSLLMGILNVTPDSFSDGGKYFDIENAINHAKELINCGVDIIDIGGESTRPGAAPVLEEEELRRVIPIISSIRNLKSKICISIDTYKSNVAKIALESGANIINDVSGLTRDPEMVHVAVAANCQIVIMHNTGIPAVKPIEHDRRGAALLRPANVVHSVYAWLENQTNYAIKNAIKIRTETGRIIRFIQRSLQDVLPYFKGG